MPRKQTQQEGQAQQQAAETQQGGQTQRVTVGEYRTFKHPTFRNRFFKTGDPKQVAWLEENGWEDVTEAQQEPTEEEVMEATGLDPTGAAIMKAMGFALPSGEEARRAVGARNRGGAVGPVGAQDAGGGAVTVEPTTGPVTEVPDTEGGNVTADTTEVR